MGTNSPDWRRDRETIRVRAATAVDLPDFGGQEQVTLPPVGGKPGASRARAKSWQSVTAVSDGAFPLDAEKQKVDSPPLLGLEPVELLVRICL
jgi:hypothetical protein